MPRGTSGRPATCEFPADGAYRVAADPIALPTGPWSPGTGPGRFDDPRGHYSVRYLGHTLAGCLKEKLAQFRRNETAELLLAALPPALPPDEEVDDDLDAYDVPEPGHEPDDAVLAWLEAQRFVQVRLRSPSARCVDLTAPRTVHYLSCAQDFRTILGTPAVRRAYHSGRRKADVTVAGLAAPDAPRAVTQAASRVVFEDPAGFAGIGSCSCVEDTEQCWTVYGRTKVVFAEPECLLDARGEALDALRAAATATGVALPAPFR